MDTVDVTFLEFLGIAILVWVSSLVENLNPYVTFLLTVSGIIWIGYRIFQGGKSSKRAVEKRAEEKRAAQLLEEKRADEKRATQLLEEKRADEKEKRSEERREHLLRMKKLRRELGEDLD